LSATLPDTNRLQDEPKLVEELSKGNAAAYTALYHYYSVRIFDTAMMYVKDSEEAKEIVQTIFIRLWEKREKLAFVLSFKDYLFIIARNEIFSYFREKAREQKNTGKLVTLEIKYTEDTDYKARESRYKEVLQRGIERLAPQQKKVYILSRQQEKSIDEIAAELNISRNTARNHLTIALRFMRAYLNENQHSCVALPLLFVLCQ
jgi:RNA polymerase sigma-70 factor (family 1)